MKKIQELKEYIKSKYENQSWNGLYEGSLGESFEDGKQAGKIELLHELGCLIGLNLVEPPDFYEEECEWNGKTGMKNNDD